MATAYYRLLATAKHLSDELKTETDRRKAMELCFKKIHTSLDMYKGHYINRLRFHMNRHHTEYLRKVRANNNTKERTASPAPRSQRVGIASDMAKEIQRLEKVLAERNEEIERLCALLDAKDV
jgi:two-component SAPR family response regulator